MFLSTSELPPWRTVVIATLGIWLLAGAAFAVNSLIEKHIDEKWRARACARFQVERLSPWQAIVFSGLLGGVGMWLLGSFVNPLTMWLTFATFVGYAVVYTVLLKPLRAASSYGHERRHATGARLGSSDQQRTRRSVASGTDHFRLDTTTLRALALYRLEDYRKAGLPMLPVTHGVALTRLHILMYTLVLVAVTTLPFLIFRMAGLLYLATALALGAIFVGYAWRLHRSYSDKLARATFGYSIVYLAALFAALLFDKFV